MFHLSIINIYSGPVWTWLSPVDFQLTLSANSEVDAENTMNASNLGAYATGTLTPGLGK